VRACGSSELEPRVRGREDVLVARVGDDVDEQTVEPEQLHGRQGERDVPVVRRIEGAAQKPYCHSRTSSPTSTSAPRLTPALRSASSSSGAGGGVPTTR
jgi:hypothetical protein